jgi:DHA2 family multidrug resistance protein-like MFS transporter
VWSIPYPLGFVVGSMLTPRLVRRVRPAYVMAGGLLLAALGFALLARIGGTGGLPGIVAATVVFALGLAPAFTLATDLVVGSAPPERAGAAAAISETSSELGGALGIAILGTVGAAVYRTTMAAAAPAGVPPDALAVARNTVGGALEIAGGLPHEVGAGLLVAAREAFTRSLVLTALTCAGIAIATAVVAAVLLRRVGVEAGAAAAPADG